MSVMMLMLLGFMMSFAFGMCMIFAGLGDMPVKRSNHKRTVATGGGLTIIAVLGFLSLLLHQSDYMVPQMGQVLSLIWAVGFLGLMDDIYNLPAPFKFLIMGLMAIGAVYVIGPVMSFPQMERAFAMPYWLGFIGSVLWVFTVMNIVNFMDGSNGLMLCVMTIACTMTMLIALAVKLMPVYYLLLFLNAAMLGLVPLNFKSKAYIFMGDVGSLTIGFTFSIAILWMCQHNPGADFLYVGPILVMPFLVDGLLTLARRLARGENLLQAHNSHLYQRLIRAGVGHVSVAVIYGFLTVLLSVYVFLGMKYGLHKFLSFLMLPVVILSALFLLLSPKFDN